MRLKRANAGARVCALASFVVLSALALTAASALALHPDRHYEMVTPVYKGGYGVKAILAAAPDGESVAFGSSGGFAGLLSNYPVGSAYLARRGPSGWSTVSLQPPFGGVADFSAGLEYVLANGTLGPNVGVEQYSGIEDEFQLHRTDTPETAENWEAFGGIVLKKLDGGPLTVLEEGASADLCQVVVGHTEGPLLPEAVNTEEQIYDLARGCGGDQPSLRLVGLNNKVPPTVFNRHCAVELGSGNAYSATNDKQASHFNAISTDGSEMFFTTNVEKGINCHGGAHQLFVRLGGSRTLEVSKPLSTVSKPVAACAEVPCAGAAERASAYFEGASEDGSRVFFTTTARLTEEDEDEGTDLYMATIGCPPAEPECEVGSRVVTSLVDVSHAPDASEVAEVQGILKLSPGVPAPGGAHVRVYFVAHGVLSKGVNAQGDEPMKGADNLYVYDSVAGTLAFVADLCSGPELSGTAQDIRCPDSLKTGLQSEENDMSLWGNFPEAQTAGGDGRFLVFSSYGQLLVDDTDTAKDVYRYDAVTGALARVSLGEAGHDANGNDNAFNATIKGNAMGGEALVSIQHGMSTRAVSEDGTRIVFSTAAPLSPDATNGHTNVYEWHEGSVSLVSSGSAEESDGEAVISSSGRDIFFKTIQGLVLQDTDGVADVYDARLGGGFPPAPAPRQPCTGDACQGPLTNPAPLFVPGSVSQAPGENLPSPNPPPGVKKATPKCSKGKKLSHGKCVKAKAKSKKAKAKKPNKAGHRRGR